MSQGTLRCRSKCDDLVGGLPMELEVEFGLRPSVVPSSEGLQVGATETALCDGSRFERDTYTWCLPREPRHSRDRAGTRDDAPGNEPTASLILTREKEGPITHSDMLASIHRLRCAEIEHPRGSIDDVSFDSERHGRLALTTLAALCK